MQTINIGHDSMLIVNHVMAVLGPNSAPIKTMKRHAKDINNFIDATYGRPTRSIIVLINGWVVASSVSSESINGRILSLTKSSQIKP